ncbi:MAG: class I SAM-dependent methyltransferase [Blastocatellia bacterium]
MEKVEAVSIDSLAEAWSNEQGHGAGDTFDMVRAYILSDLQTTQVEFWKCFMCGLEMADPMRSWTAAHYPKESQDLGFDHQVAIAELKKIPPARILEIGCADGRFLKQAKALGHEVMGIDFSDEAINAAKGAGLDVKTADVNEISKLFAGKPGFNVIVLFQIIEHFEQPERVFNQISEIATKDAMLMVGCPSDLRYTRAFRHPQRIKRSDFWDYPPQHTLRWTSDALKTFLMRYNWRTESTFHEPLNVIGAAAHLTALGGLHSGWKAERFRRRLETLRWILRVSSRKAFGSITGIRLLTIARHTEG